MGKCLHKKFGDVVVDCNVGLNFVTGTTFIEYQGGAWIELSELQIAFAEANPDATAKEIIEKELMPPLPEQPVDRYTTDEKNDFIEGLMEGLGL